uniref:Uncharacterized protein n=1 Tax=Ciona savignyi TaxID=51511 RepID=H2YEV5_CIOSA
MFRRFFLVDNVVGILQSSPSNPTTFIRYASSISISTSLQPIGNGLIYPPQLTITYTDLPVTSGVPDSPTVSTRFSVLYLISSTASNAQIEGFKISLAVLGSLSVLYSFFETGSWRRRQGLQFIDATSLFMFIFYSMSNLANVFFIVVFGFSAVTLIFYKVSIAKPS